MYRAFVLLNLVVAAPLVLAGLRVAASISEPFPTGFLWYYPVVFGFLGVIGLYRVARSPLPRSDTRARNDIVFLSAGVLGAASLILGSQRHFSPLLVAAWIWPGLLLSGPVAIAILEIVRRMPALRQGRRSARVAAAIVIAILLLPIAMGVSRVAAKKALTSWYGRNFPANAAASAERIAAGHPYRLYIAGYPPNATFDDLDEDELLDNAFENHFKIGGLNGLWIEPHMTLHVGDDRYFWSFRAGEFLPVVPSFTRLASPATGSLHQEE